MIGVVEDPRSSGAVRSGSERETFAAIYRRYFTYVRRALARGVPSEDRRFAHDVPAVPLALHAAASAPQDDAETADVQILVEASDAAVSLGDIVVTDG
jgi:hypothetical protein